MYRFKFISTLGDSVEGTKGRYEIQTSKGLIVVDVDKGRIHIPFEVQVKPFPNEESHTHEIDLIEASKSEAVFAGYYTLELKCIISEDEVLIAFWRWSKYVPTGYIMRTSEIADRN